MKKIIKKLKSEIADIKRLNMDMDEASFSYEQGIIITGNEAQEILDFIGEEAKSAAAIGSTVDGTGEDAGLKNGGWISSKDRLPNEVGVYLVYSSDDIFIAYFENDEFCNTSANGSYWFVPKSWMPLPGKPAGDF